MADVVVGEEIQGYRIQREIGRGRLGPVFEVLSEQNPSPAALRLVDPSLLRGSTHQVRLHKALQISARLSHPNLCTFREVGVRQGQVFLVSDLAEGPPLSALARREEFRDLDRILRLVEDLLEACSYLHRSGVVHGGIEPGAVFVGDYGRALLADPGLVRALREDGEGTTRAGEVFPPRYAPPETVSAFPHDERSDLFQVGLILHELLMGQPYYRSERLADLADEIKNPPPIPRDESWPQGLDTFLAKALAADPDERWSKAHIMLAQVRGIQARLAAADPLRGQGKLRDYLEAVLARRGRGEALGTLLELRGDACIWETVDGEGRPQGHLCYLPGRLLQNEALSASGLCARTARLKAKRPPHLVLPAEIVIRGQDALCLYPLPEGRSVQETLRSGRRLLLSQILSVYHEVCEGLEVLHELELFYEDFAPDRVLLVFRRGQATPEPQLLYGGVSDLLLHGHLSADNTRIRPVSPYLAPEVMRRAQGDVASDVYSLGTLLFEALSGLPPPVAGKLHLGPTFSALSPKPPDAVRAGLRELLERTLNPMPSKRFRSSAQVRARLEDVLCQLGEHPSKRGASTLGLFVRSTVLFLLLALITAGALAMRWKAPRLAARAMTARAGLDSATLSWTCNHATRSDVIYGVAGRSRTSEQSSPSKGERHLVDLSGLQPGKSYTWAVRFPDGRCSEPRSFQTLPLRTRLPLLERSFGTHFVTWDCDPPLPGLLEVLVPSRPAPIPIRSPKASRHRVSLHDVPLEEGATIRVLQLLPGGGRVRVGEVEIPSLDERLAAFLHATREERMLHLESMARSDVVSSPDGERRFEEALGEVRRAWEPLSASTRSFLDAPPPSPERTLQLWERLARLEILQRLCEGRELRFELPAWPVEGSRFGSASIDASDIATSSSWSPPEGLRLLALDGSPPMERRAGSDASKKNCPFRRGPRPPGWSSSSAPRPFPPARGSSSR